MDNELLNKGMELYDNEKYEESASYLLKFKDTKIPLVLFRIGKLYLNGYGVDKDEKIAVYYLRKSSKKGYLRATNNLSYCYLEGLGVKKSVKKAVKLCLLSAKKGSHIAQLTMGKNYLMGRFVKKSTSKGICWLKKASDSGYAPAMHYLGQYFYDRSDYQTAIKYFESAAKLSYDISILKLGFLYLTGPDEFRNIQSGIDWLDKGDKMGSAIVQANLSYIYLTGCGVPKDKKKAFNYALKAAKKKYGYAQYLLGLCYMNGYGVSKNKEESMKWFKKAAINGNAESQYIVGKADYEYGYDRRKKSIEWILKAAEQNHPNAQFLAYRYYILIAKDKVKALFWFDKAVENKQVDALFFQAEGYEKAHSYGAAFNLYMEASKQGHLDAKKGAERCAEYVRKQMEQMGKDPEPIFVEKPKQHKIVTTSRDTYSSSSYDLYDRWDDYRSSSSFDDSDNNSYDDSPSSYNDYGPTVSRAIDLNSGDVGYSINGRNYDSHGDFVGYEVGDRHYDAGGNCIGYRVDDREYGPNGESLGYWNNGTFYSND